MESTTASGRRAEEVAQKWLEDKYGLRMIAKNWRTRTCEIDLIMQKGNDFVAFVEVKYRASNYGGGGIDSITKTKLRKMYHGANEWTAKQTELGLLDDEIEMRLSAIEISGSDFKITKFIPTIYYDR